MDFCNIFSTISIIVLICSWRY